MGYRIAFSDDAIADIKSIKDFYSNEKYSKEQVKKLYAQIKTTIEYLHQHPEIGKRITVELYSDYRYIVAGLYLIFYKVYDGIIYIVRVVHERRSLVADLLDEYR